MNVIIDGLAYRPQTDEEKAIDAEVQKLLCDVYGELWTEAYYDGFSDATIKFAQPLADKMAALNKILKFKK